MDPKVRLCNGLSNWEKSLWYHDPDPEGIGKWQLPAEDVGDSFSSSGGVGCLPMLVMALILVTILLR